MYFRRIVSFAVAAFMLCASVCIGAAADEGEPSVSAASAVLYCADNGEVLYQKDMNTRRPIASITKIMTAVIALEYARSNDVEVTITPEMYAEGSSMYLKEGEVISLTELVKGMMMVSGNDAANAIALTIGTSIEGFAEIMNEKAALLGMTNTNFVTPSGLDDENHYSTAYDMALLCAYAMDNEDFVDIVSQESIEVSFIEPDEKTVIYTNHNRLLSMYDGCIGIKTGYTSTAGRTLTSCAERDGVRLIVVTLNDGDDWQDHAELFDYGFSLVDRQKAAYSTDSYAVALVGGEEDYINVSPAVDVELTTLKGQEIKTKVYLPYFIYAPVRKGQVVGYMEFIVDGKVVSKCNLLVT